MSLQTPYIGKVKSHYAEPTNPGIMREAQSEIEIFEKYTDGLFKIELSDYLEVYFHFDKADPCVLQTYTYTGDYKGVFATRSPRRPSKIGSTLVKLLERRGNTLLVQGLDALDGTPVLDIKPMHIPLTEEQVDEAEIHSRKNNPRKQVFSNIWANRTDRLMLDAARMHGHFCPGLAMGVMMAARAMQLMRANSDGLEDLLAIVETNNCISDGIQYVTGCSFGNNGLIFMDIGKTAFTLARRDGKGYRIASRANVKEYMRQTSPLFSESYQKVVTENDRSEEEVVKFKTTGIEKAFATLALDFDKLFTTEEVTVEIPAYAPVHESIICDLCGEPIMASRIIHQHNKNLCMPCAGHRAAGLTGHGISIKTSPGPAK
ncbi:MAG TPA: TrmO family methyltransferase [Bacteroidales bacterium]|nr:TrmO family methyltransferase [Bacteroidales bacterium]